MNSVKTLVLGLGNEFLSDDGVGILAARRLREELHGLADVVESTLAGLALLDYFIGYDRAIIIDSVMTGRQPPGTIYELAPDDLDAILVPSPHYAGLPEMLAVARSIKVGFPREIKILALEVEDPYTIGGELTPAVRGALKELIQRVQKQVRLWQEELLCTGKERIGSR